MTGRYVVIGVLAVLGGVVWGWRIWTQQASMPHVGVPDAIPSTQTNQAPPPGLALPIPRVATEATPAPVCPDCVDLPGDPRLAEVARRSDFYQDYADQLRPESAGELARRWPEVVGRHDPDELPAFLGVFADSLRAAEDAAIYQELADVLNDPLATPEAKGAILTLLGRTATPQAVEILAACLASGSVGEGLAETLRGSIREASAALIDGHWNWDVSPVLEQAWRQRSPTLADPDRAALTQGIGDLSTAEGTRLLLDTLNATGTASDLDRDLAAAALATLEANAAVPVLEQALAGEPDPRVTKATLGALVNIDTADAYLALVAYLSRATNLDAKLREDLSRDMAEHGLSDESAKVVREAVERGTFAQDAVRALLVEVLDTQSG